MKIGLVQRKRRPFVVVDGDGGRGLCTIQLDSAWWQHQSNFENFRTQLVDINELSHVLELHLERKKNSYYLMSAPHTHKRVIHLRMGTQTMVTKAHVTC